MNNKKHSCLYASFLFWLLISIFASALLIWCARKAYGSINPKQILFLEALVVLSLALHLKHETDRQTMSGKLPSAGKQTGYTARAFSLADTLVFTNSNPSYDIRYDYIRLFAVFCVILLHCLGIAMPELSMEITDETRALLQEIPPLLLKPAAVLHTCLYLGNTCFLMLTGALLFGRGTKGGIASFYERRFSKVVLTSVIYFFFYMWQNGRLNPVCADTLREAFHRILSGSIQEDCPFLWLVYMTLSIYVAVPFLQYMFEAMPYRALTSLSAVVLVCMFLKTYTLMTTDLLPFFAQWIGIAMIGYWISRPETRKYDRWIWILAALSFLKVVLSVNPYVYWQSYVNYYVHMAPLSIFMACGIFALALHKKPEQTHRFSPLITMLGKHSFTILLLHWWVLYHLAIYTLNLDITWRHPLTFTGTILFVIATSLVCGFLIDQTVVYAIRTLFEATVKQAKRIAK